MKQICFLTSMPNLKVLSLCNNSFIPNIESNNLTLKSIKYLMKTNWLNLEHINLSGNRIGSIGVKQLTKCNWPNLTALNLCTSYNILEFCSIKDEGFTYFIEANWKKLTDLNIYGCYGYVSWFHFMVADLQNLKNCKVYDYTLKNFNKEFLEIK